MTRTSQSRRSTGGNEIYCTGRWLKTKNIPATQQQPSPVNNYGDRGDGKAIAGSVAIWWRGGRGVVSVGVNLSPNLEASRERFATCRCRSHGNREGLSFHFVTIGRTESRPSWWRRWGVFSPICRIRRGSLVSRLLSSCLPCKPLPAGTFLQARQRRPRYARLTSLPRAPKHTKHHAIHRSGAGPVQRFLERLACPRRTLCRLIVV
jgi:hypothetical protein